MGFATRTLATLAACLALAACKPEGAAQAPPPAPPPAVGVINQDQGPLGAVVADSLQHSSLVSASAISVTDGDSKLKDRSLVAYVVFPPDFSQSAQSGVIAPEVHVEGTQPSAVAPVLAALQQALASAASRAPGAIRFAPKVTYLYAGAGLDQYLCAFPKDRAAEMVERSSEELIPAFA